MCTTTTISYKHCQHTGTSRTTICSTEKTNSGSCNTLITDTRDVDGLCPTCAVEKAAARETRTEAFRRFSKSFVSLKTNK